VIKPTCSNDQSHHWRKCLSLPTYWSIWFIIIQKYRQPCFDYFLYRKVRWQYRLVYYIRRFSCYFIDYYFHRSLLVVQTGAMENKYMVIVFKTSIFFDWCSLSTMQVIPKGTLPFLLEKLRNGEGFHNQFVHEHYFVSWGHDKRMWTWTKDDSHDGKDPYRDDL